MLVLKGSTTEPRVSSCHRLFDGWTVARHCAPRLAYHCKRPAVGAADGRAFGAKDDNGQHPCHKGDTNLDAMDDKLVERNSICVQLHVVQHGERTVRGDNEGVELAVCVAVGREQAGIKIDVIEEEKRNGPISNGNGTFAVNTALSEALERKNKQYADAKWDRL